MMLTAFVLVCSLAITPDLSGCNRDNAVDVMRVPDQFGNPATCFFMGQAYLAQTEIGRGLTENEQVKVVCARSQTAETVAPVR